MKNTSINISGKLPKGLVELYTDIVQVANHLEIELLVVGAMARNLVLHHGYGAVIERGTQDVDFGIHVAGWDEFHNLKNALLNVGFHSHERINHTMMRDDSDGLPWEIDIVPFGPIAHNNNLIHWPPDQSFVMSVLGFAETFEHAMSVQINEKPTIIIKVASPASLALLKLIAWTDRKPELRGKDASDFRYLIQTYAEIPDIFDAIYEQGQMEAQDWDEPKATAMKLGHDSATIAHSETATLLENTLFNQPDKRELLVSDMQKGSNKSKEQCAELLDIFIQAFQKNTS